MPHLHIAKKKISLCDSQGKLTFPSSPEIKMKKKRVLSPLEKKKDSLTWCIFLPMSQWLKVEFVDIILYKNHFSTAKRKKIYIYIYFSHIRNNLSHC